MRSSISLKKKLLDEQSFLQIGKYKGFFYVGLTAFLLYFLIRARSQRLLSSKQDFKRLFEDNPSPMWIYALDTFRILLANKAACHQYGYNQEEFLSLSLYDLRPQACLEKSVDTAQEGYSDSGEWIHQSKAGARFYVHIFSHSILYQHRACRLVMAINVHQKVLLEQQLKLRNQCLSEIA
jgi:PAS domain S-box-containing protein